MPARSWAPLLFFSQQRGKEERNLIPLYLSLFQKLIEVLFVKVGVLYTCISAQWVADLQILFPSSWYISYLSLCVKKISSPCPFFFFVSFVSVFFLFGFQNPQPRPIRSQRITTHFSPGAFVSQSLQLGWNFNVFL